MRGLAPRLRRRWDRPRGCGGGGGGGATSTSAPRAVTSTTVSDHATPPTTSTGPVPSTTVAPAVTLARGFRLTSPRFARTAPIPRALHLRRRRRRPPPLRFSGVPRATRELVLDDARPGRPGRQLRPLGARRDSAGDHALQRGGVPGQIVPGRNSFGSPATRALPAPWQPCAPLRDHLERARQPLRPEARIHDRPAPARPRWAIATLVGTYRARLEPQPAAQTTIQASPSVPAARRGAAASPAGSRRTTAGRRCTASAATKKFSRSPKSGSSSRSAASPRRSGSPSSRRRTARTARAARTPARRARATRGSRPATGSR